MIQDLTITETHLAWSLSVTIMFWHKLHRAKAPDTLLSVTVSALSTQCQGHVHSHTGSTVAVQLMSSLNQGIKGDRKYRHLFIFRWLPGDMNRDRAECVPTCFRVQQFHQMVLVICFPAQPSSSLTKEH